MNFIYLYLKIFKIFFEFYKNCEENFITDVDKNYYVFTDNDEILNIKQSNINTYYIPKLTWPLDTLLRFKYFLKAKSRLEENDFLFFFNANVLFNTKISKEEFLPSWKNNFTVVLHWWLKKFPFFLLPYERNKKSHAYISYFTYWKYFQWSINGGKTEKFLDFISWADENINRDLNKNIIPKVHDESLLNRYMIWRDDVKILDVDYNYPEWSNLKYSPKIILKEKTKDKNHESIRK